MNDAESLREEVKVIIFRELNITHRSIEDIAGDTPLFGEGGLGLDSLDGLQIASAVEEHFNIRLPEGDEVRPVLRSVDAIAAYIAQQRG
jgi:acyl carrier protein